MEDTKAGAPIAEVLTGTANYAAKATQMVSAARNDIALLTQELDRRIYGSGIFNESLRRFVLQHSHTKVRILVNSTQMAISNSPRLVELGRGLSSFVEFRELQPARRQVVREELLITDGRVMLFRESPGDLEAKFYGQSPAEARLKLKGFDQLWDESEPAQELRRLGV
jgi:hypothetical protein